MSRLSSFSVVAACLIVPFAVLAAPPPKPPPAPLAKPKPKPSASASASTSASVVASASASVAPTTSASSSYVAPVGPPVSPLTPRPDETPPVKASASAKPGANYDQLMAEIAALRARVGVVGNGVWKSKMAVTVRLRGSHAKVVAAKLAVDGAPVWNAPKGFAAEDDTTVFDGGVAPGPHSVTIEIERHDDRDPTFRSIDKTTTTVQVPEGKKLDVEVRLEDDSSMGGDFPSDKEGKYDLRIKIKAKAK